MTTPTTNKNVAAVTAVKDVPFTGNKRNRFAQHQTEQRSTAGSGSTLNKSTTNKSSYKTNSTIFDPYRNELEVIILICCYYLLLVIYILVPTSSWINIVGIVQANNYNNHPFSPRSGSTSTPWMTKIGSTSTTTPPKGPFQGLSSSSYNSAARGGSAITVSKRKTDGVHDLESYLRERQQQKQFTNEDYYTSYDDTINDNDDNDNENVVAMETSLKTETTTTTTNDVQVEEPIDQELLIKETRHLLNVKLHEVLTGQRGRNFAKHYGKKRDAIDGAFTSDGILSTHGRRTTSSTTTKTSTSSTATTTKTSTPVTSTKTTTTKSKQVAVQSSTTKDELTSSVLDVLHELEVEDELKEPSALRLLIRALRLSWNFAPIYWTCGLAYFSPTFRTNIWYKWLSKCLAKSGPAFIKWGQWASTRQDMFPNELCQELSSLHASAPAHSWKFTQTTVEHALKLPKGTLLEVFESFDPQPLASGSIAQVHRAVLKPDPYYTPNVLEQEYTKFIKQLPSQVQQHVPSVFPFTDQHREEGMTVAVKVRHPMVAELIDWDFRIMLRLADVVDSLPALRWLNVRSSVEQFSHTMAAQSHLNVEADHLDVLNYNFRHWSKIGFPKPFFSHPTMICETFESGRIVTDIIDDYEQQQQTRKGNNDDLTFQTPGELLNSNNNNNKDENDSSGTSADHIPLELAEFLVTNGLSIYLKMLLVDNLMHADLHPGNIMCCINDCMRRKRQKYQSKHKRNADGNTKKNKNQTIKTKAVVGQVGGDIAIESKKMIKQKNARKEKTLTNRNRKDEKDDCGCDGDVTSSETSNNKNNDYPFEANMILVDAGMVARLEEEEADNFIGFMASLGEGDGKQAALAALNFSTSSEGEPEYSLSDEQRDAFIHDMEDMFAKYCRGYGTNVDVGEILRQVLQLIRIHKVRIDANYATLVINALCIEGLAKRVAPTYNVLDAAQPLLQSYYRICGTNRSRKSATRDRNYKIRHAIMRCWMPLMYIKKSAKDKLFFWKLKRQRRLVEAKQGSNNNNNRSSRQNISKKHNPKLKQTLIEALVGTGIFLLAVHLIPESLVTNKLSDVRQSVVDTFNGMTTTFNELGQYVLDSIPDTVKDIFKDDNNEENTLPTKKGKGKAQ